MIAMKENTTSSQTGAKMRHQGTLGSARAQSRTRYIFYGGGILIEAALYMYLGTCCCQKCGIHTCCAFLAPLSFFFFWLSTPDKGTWNLVSSLLVN